MQRIPQCTVLILLLAACDPGDGARSANETAADEHAPAVDSVRTGGPGGDAGARARAIAMHPPIAEAELERIQSTLGAQMPEFERADMAVHEASIRMHEAAQAADLDALMDHLGTVQHGCMDCHARFRERLRTTTP